MGDLASEQRVGGPKRRAERDRRRTLPGGLRLYGFFRYFRNSDSVVTTILALPWSDL